MLATFVHADVAGSKIAVSARPSWPVVKTPSPPATRMRPSGRCALPAQKMLPGAFSVVGNVCDVGFQTVVGCGCSQPSNTSTLPVLSRTECTATIGQVISALHCPPGDAPGVTALEAAEAGPVPTALVALTVNV